MTMFMKKLITLPSMLTLLFLAQAAAVSATDYMPFIKIATIPSEKKFSLTVTNLKEDAAITLRDGQTGAILIQKSAEAGVTFAKIFNLANLPTGPYYVSVKTSMQESVQPLNLTEYGVEADPSKIRKFYAPVIKVHDKKYVDVSYFAGKIDDVIVSIFDNNGATVFKERLDNVLLVEKRYDLKTLPWGRYTVQVETANDVYVKEFDVR